MSYRGCKVKEEKYNLKLKYKELTIKIEINGSKRSIKKHFGNSSNIREVQEAISNIAND
tara:strand:+ start:2510 stop:2686 length:177 start_codon:yes stop_codon:yes gene_type:complete